MKRGMIFVTAVLLTVLCGSAAIALTPQAAPLNPDFLEYLAEQRNGTTPETGAKRPFAPLPPPPIDFSHLAGKPLFTGGQGRRSGELPVSYDLRTLGEVPPIRDQNPFGLCWAFGAIAAIESSLLKEGTVADLSEWQLGYSAFHDPNPFKVQARDYWYDAGGSDLMAVAVLARWEAPTSEEAVPYPPTNPPSPDFAPTGKEPAAWHLQEAPYLYVDFESEHPYATQIGRDNVKRALMRYGAVAFGIHATEAMVDDVTSTDSWNCEANAFNYQGEESGNHAVAVVGWDESYPRENFATQPPEDGAWIVRNSWGSQWGDEGYFFMSYHSGSTNSGAAYVVASADNYDHIHQYDPYGESYCMGYDDTTAWFANVFRADEEGPEGELVQAVSFYNNAASADYAVTVYRNLPEETDSPTAGVAMGTTTGRLDHPGYVTIPLEHPAYVQPGQCFSVVVRLTAEDYRYPVTMEYRLPNYSSGATIEPGQSYLSANGETWTDAYTISEDGGCNVCLKAFTDDASRSGGCNIGPSAAALFLLLSPGLLFLRR